VVVLAGDVIDALIDEGLLLKASRRELALSAVAVAVPAGTPLPDIASAQALRETLLAAPRIGYSTGPSGQALLRLFEQWQLSEVLAPRLVLAQPGVPVGRLLADGRVEIGFQQLSELQGMDGVAVVGVMPPGLEIVTSFVGAVSVHSSQPQAAQRLLDFMAAPATATLKQRYGMEAP
jgi:molybdate transport system substrate-binding protein